MQSRRHVKPRGIRNIGKEFNRWEEQYHLGADESAEIDYGSGVPEPKPLLVSMREQITRIGQREVARKSGIARRTIERFMRGENVRSETFDRLWRILFPSQRYHRALCFTVDHGCSGE